MLVIFLTNHEGFLLSCLLYTLMYSQTMEKSWALFKTRCASTRSGGLFSVAEKF